MTPARFRFEDALGYSLNRAALALRTELRRRFRAAGHRIAVEEWAVLNLLWVREARTPSELADGTVKDRAVLTRILDSLERKGALVRRRHKEDARSIEVHLTRKGRALQAELVPIAVSLLKDATRGVSSRDVATSHRVLGRVFENLSDD